MRTGFCLGRIVVRSLSPSACIIGHSGVRRLQVLIKPTQCVPFLSARTAQHFTVDSIALPEVIFVVTWICHKDSIVLPLIGHHSRTFTTGISLFQAVASIDWTAIERLLPQLCPFTNNHPLLGASLLYNLFHTLPECLPAIRTTLTTAVKHAV